MFIYTALVLTNFKHTHVDGRAVAGQAGAVVILCSHVHRVLLSTVQVVPGAGGGVGETLMGVAIKPSCYCDICFGTITGPPADRAHVVLTLYVGCHIAGDTWSWAGGEDGGEYPVKQTHGVKTNARKCATEIVSY